MPTFQTISSIDEFLVNTTTASSQFSPAVTGLSDGRYIITWMDFSGTGGDTFGSAIRAQFFGADSRAIGTEFLVNTTTSIDQTQPDVVELANGNIVVVWQDFSAFGTPDETTIRAQILDPSGALIGSELDLISRTGIQQEPVVEALPSGGFVLAWTDFGFNPPAEGGEIVTTQYDDLGAAVPGTFSRVNEDVFQYQGQPDIAVLENGNYVITWDDRSGTTENIGGSDAVHARIYAPDGTAITYQFLVNTTIAGSQFSSTITALADGRFVVAWQDLSMTGADTDLGAIRAQIFGADGTPFGAEFLVNTMTTGNQEDPEITALPSGGFAIVWENSFDIASQLYDANGTPVETEFMVNTGTFNFQLEPDIATLADGRFIVTWADESGSLLDQEGFAVHAQVYSAPVIDVIDFPETESRFLGESAVLVVQDGASLTTIGQSAVDAEGGPAQVIVNGLVASYATSDISAVLLDNTISDVGGHSLTVSQYGSIQTNSGFAVRFEGTGNRFDNAGSVLGNVSLGDGAGMYSATGVGHVLGYVAGGFGADTMLGADQADHFIGDDGSDSLVGRDGDDTLVGELGLDTLRGGAGNDSLSSGSNSDMVYGGSGDDTIDSGSGSDVVHGNSGDDSIIGGSAFDTILGGSGDDTVDGGSNSDLIYGGDGNDSLLGDSSADTIRGGADDDYISGGTSTDQLFGGSGDDDIHGDEGSDTIEGGSGDDLIAGGDDADLIFGGSGDDDINGDDDNDSIEGGSGNDLLRGSAGDDQIEGGAGEDTLSGGTENDLLNGGSGFDDIFGGSGDDTLQGTLGNDRLFGSTGNDFLYGGSDDDTLNGGDGQDLLSGGNGADVFVFDEVSHSDHGNSTRDTITDFVSGEDMIDLSGFGITLTYIGSAAYSGAAGEVRYNATIGRLYINEDTIAGSDFSIDLIGAPALVEGDLIL